MNEIRTTYVQRLLKEGWKLGWSESLSWHWFREGEYLQPTENDLQQMEVLLALVHVDGLINHGS